MDITKPFVVGAGIMGAGIGQLCSQNGYEVTVVDISDEIVSKAEGKVQAGLNRRVEKGKITQEDMESVLSRIRWSTDLNLAGDSDFVVEAVLENGEITEGQGMAQEEGAILIYHHLEGIIRVYREGTIMCIESRGCTPTRG